MQNAVANPGSSMDRTSFTIFDDFGRTDAANALRLARRFGDWFRYWGERGVFLVWDESRWRVDTLCRMDQLAKRISGELFREIADLADEHPRSEAALRTAIIFAQKASSAQGIQSMLKLVRSEPGICVDGGQLDRDPMLLNLRNGTFDLRRGVLRAHAVEDFCTKLCPVEYNARAVCPTWDRFAHEVFQGNIELIEYVQRAAGYSLTGDVREQALFLCVGDGANGKSTLLNILLHLMGQDYAMKAATELLVARKQRGHPTELIDLFGKRFVAAIETEADQRLAESFVKELTGGDRIRARGMRENFFEFAPTHKIWMATNYHPTIRGTDEGIWRRLKVIPFRASFTEQPDKKLERKLRGELPGILNWCLRGCDLWLQAGLAEPIAVSTATTGYRAEMDLVGRFLAECCEFEKSAKIGAGELQRAFRAWCASNGESETGAKSFAQSLERRGIARRKSGSLWYLGLRLTFSEPDEVAS